MKAQPKLALLPAAAAQAGTQAPSAQPWSGPQVSSSWPISSTIVWRSGLHSFITGGGSPVVPVVSVVVSAVEGQHQKPTEIDPNADLLAYKARPLNGIWASAPYLHNGSVPNLHALLLPPASRPASFSVGRWEYDPKNVGYVSDGQVPFVVDTTVSGNRNSGHEYGTTLSDEDRWALVEYLKTL